MPRNATIVLADLAALRAEPRLATNRLYIVKSTGFMYKYDDTSAAADDGVEVVKPTSVSGNGRFLRMAVGAELHAGQRAVNVLRVASNVADTETVTIGADVYEFDRAADGVTAGRIAVTGHADDTPTNALTALETKINAKVGVEKVTAVKISANELLIIADEPGAVVLACAETLAGANNAWAAAAMYGGKAVASSKTSTQKRVPNATEVALGNMHFLFDFTPVAAIVLIAPTATPGAYKIWDGVLTISGGRVTINNAGSVDWAATDDVVVIAYE
jgi:hypothetical protein